MTQPYRLHFAPDNASLIIRIALNALGVPYDPVLVDRAAQAQRSAGYLALNPLGMIPALETPDGTLFETGAILLWLSDTHADRDINLLPPVGQPARTNALKWLFFLSNSLHSSLRQMFYPEKFIASECTSALRTSLASRIRADFARLDGLIADPAEPTLGGASLSALDIYTCTCFRWAQLYPTGYTKGWVQPADYPNLLDLAAKLERHSAVQAAQSAEGLGPTPFSNPVLCTPPIGSAT